jgi:hypothetical protein
MAILNRTTALVNPLSTTAPHRYWRAQVTAGDGTTSLNVSLLATQ